MSTVYYGSSNGPGDGNWNNVNNWFSNPGGVNTTPTALGRLPNPATDSVAIYDGTISTGPTGGYSGSITIFQNCTIAAGTYSGVISVFSGTPIGTPYVAISGGNFSGNLANQQLQASGYTAGSISGGTFTGNFTLGGSASSYCGSISGGTFTGTIAMDTAHKYNGLITGGTYSPTYNIAVKISSNMVVPATPAAVSKDPGFWAYGTYSPVITFTGFPDILGMGLL